MKEFGRRPYISDSSETTYAEEMKRVTDKELFNIRAEHHSEFKKPYFSPAYEGMEYYNSPYPVDPYDPDDPGSVRTQDRSARSLRSRRPGSADLHRSQFCGVATESPHRLRLSIADGPGPIRSDGARASALGRIGGNTPTAGQMADEGQTG